MLTSLYPLVLTRYFSAGLLTPPASPVRGSKDAPALTESLTQPDYVYDMRYDVDRYSLPQTTLCRNATSPAVSRVLLTIEIPDFVSFNISVGNGSNSVTVRDVLRSVQQEVNKRKRTSSMS